ncbi:endonuclease IV [Bacillus sp. AFS076308]|uniref:deoxyribonuclease IV n=1 Tax=unclassified Bacillus (in: firmicutes) TaxID=185979 RepID=UPI000BF533D8|nr:MULTISPECIES: deoxyribonuclease IV [unclassified Bacillus (in: firmicutes)]PFN96932.1 endonuclease IV [Bacillus sp. AFS076308]PGV48893.1 endonuclease IV [Bacillus sp. AFS037270]
MIFGSHVSIRDGYLGAAKRAVANKASAFQYFPKNPRSLTIKDFDQEDAKSCKDFCLEHQLFSVAHTPYSTSITPSKDKHDLTIASLHNDLEITDACGSIGVVVHYGSQISKTDPLASYHLMLDILNSVLSKWNGSSLILLENNAGTKGALGTTIEELVQIRNLCEYPEKIGFCLDTCHAYASGLWNGENTEELIEKGESLGYWEHIKAIHLNNSKYPTGSKKDRHANIFNSSNGYINAEQLKELVKTPVLAGIPLILETPDDEGVSHREEIKMLKQKWEK